MLPPRLRGGNERDKATHQQEPFVNWKSWSPDPGLDQPPALSPVDGETLYQ